MNHIYQFTFDNIIFNTIYSAEEKLDMLKGCVEIGVNIEDESVTSMLNFLIGKYKYQEIINYLLTLINFKNIDKDLIQIAYRKNDLETMEIFLNMGMDPNFDFQIYTSASMVKLLVKYGKNIFDDDLFCSACLWGNLELVKYLVDMGVYFANPNNNPTIQLFERDGDADIKKFLLDNGAYDDSLLDISFNRIDYNDCKLLLDYGSDISGCTFKCRDDYRNQLEKLIELFSEYGYDIRDLINKG